MWDDIVGELTGSFAAVPMDIAILRLAAAVILGGAIGLEREWKEKAAGLRTHILVATAACLFTLVGQELAVISLEGDDGKRTDFLRLIEATTSGVAFLAAGLIFTSGGEVRNITTGASMWLAGAIGLGCGAGKIPLAVLATIIVVLVLYGIGKAEEKALKDQD